MLTVISSFIGAILVMGMDSAQSMYFFKHKDEGKAEQACIISAILQWRLLLGTGIVVIATLLAPLLNTAFFNGKLSLEYFAVAFVSVLFSQILIQSAEVMRLLYRPWSYISITLTQSLLSAAFVLFFVLVLDQGILGFLLGSLSASVIIAIFGWYRVGDYIDFSRVHYSLWPKLVRFGAPLVPAGIAIYFMSTADRWFVQHYHGPEALGLYAVGAKFSMLMALGVDTFRKAWWPIAMDSMHSSDGPATFRLIGRLYMGLGIAVVVVLTLISPLLVQWFTGDGYHEAWPIVGILAWQSLFYGFFLIASAGIWKVEKTYINLYLMVGASLFGLLLNWILVPEYAGIGAAIATAITYLLWITASMIVSEFLWRVSFSWPVMGFQIIIGGIFVIWYLSNGADYHLHIKIGVGLFFVFLLVLTAVERSTVMMFIRSFKAN